MLSKQVDLIVRRKFKKVVDAKVQEIRSFIPNITQIVRNYLMTKAPKNEKGDWAGGLNPSGFPYMRSEDSATSGFLHRNLLDYYIPRGVHGVVIKKGKQYSANITVIFNYNKVISPKTKTNYALLQNEKYYPDYIERLTDIAKKQLNDYIKGKL
jgi:hypothetical protein